MKTVILNVGHTKFRQGAKNKTSGITEWQVNSLLAPQIADKINKVILQKIEVIIVNDSFFNLPKKINKLNPDMVIAMHCNAYNTKTAGSEVLYGSSKYAQKAIAMNTLFSTCMPKSSRARKAKQISPTERGGKLIWGVKAPCFIIEPCFIDNDYNFNDFMNNIDKIIDAYCASIKLVL